MDRNYNLIGISGKARHGKDTTADIMRNQLKWLFDQDFDKRAFGTGVKRIAAELTGIPADQWETTEQKEMFLPSEWDYVNEEGELVQMTRRMFMKRLGGDAVAGKLHQNAWINWLFKDYNSWMKLFISDVRYKTEAKAIKNRGGLLIRVINPNVESTDTHASEVDLDDYTEWDYVILNDGSLLDLCIKIFNIIVDSGIVKGEIVNKLKTSPVLPTSGKD